MSRKDATTKAIAKARAWFGRDDLVTEPETLPWTPPEAVVELGRILAIEYLSDKFDGKMRAYRHDFTKNRTIAVSVDGGTVIVTPPMRITKRGIEG